MRFPGQFVIHPSSWGKETQNVKTSKSAQVSKRIAVLERQRSKLVLLKVFLTDDIINSHFKYQMVQMDHILVFWLKTLLCMWQSDIILFS